MIKGIGIDLVDVGSFRKIQDRSRIFTEREISYCLSKNDDDSHLAGRYALKEAVYKSLKIVEENYPDWREIEAINRDGGSIEIILTGHMAKIASDKGILKIETSITHKNEMAVAVAIALG